MSDNFTFNATTIKPYVSIETREPRNAAPRNPGTSEEDRIASARRIALARAKENNGIFERRPSYFEDFAGPETSSWDAARCVWIVQTLDIAGYRSAVPLGRARNLIGFDTYKAREGAWKLDDQRISIQEVRELINARIQELGLSMAKLFEYLAEIHSLEQSQKFILMSFAEQMDQFREGAAR
jgi:hypothetical protein